MTDRTQVALVQGASRGIGLEMVRQLLERPTTRRVIATCRRPDASEGLAALAQRHPDSLVVEPLDLTVETSIARVAAATERHTDRLHRIVNCAGLLHAGDAVQPEKKLESIDPAALQRVFEVNAFGPLLIAKHFFGLLRHDDRSVLANLSARVGSIGDDRAGGWYAYRASKAAQNMFTKNLAIELRRRAPRCICVALHPGTVETELSRPFRSRVPREKLFSVERAARQLLGVMDGLAAGDSGAFLAWDGSRIPW